MHQLMGRSPQQGQETCLISYSALQRQSSSDTTLASHVVSCHVMSTELYPGSLGPKYVALLEADVCLLDSTLYIYM